jgi:hypothetical protein
MPNIQINAGLTTLELNGSLINDFAEGDYLTLTAVNPLTSRTNSANGGVNINKRSDGNVKTLVFRVQKYSDSDILLNTIINKESPEIINGTMVENFIKDGASSKESHALEGGSITTLPTITKNNQDGSDMMEFTIEFRSGIRSI